jgi:phenylacetate-CoA ligase
MNSLLPSAGWFRQRGWEPFFASLGEPCHAEELTRWRDARLARLLAHARHAVPMFRRISPGRAAGLEDLQRHPILDRSYYQQAGLHATLAEDVQQETLLDRSTSGSTGERLAIRRTWLEERLLNCFRWRAFRSYGIGPPDRIVNALFRNETDPRDDQRLAHLAMTLGWRQMLVVDALGDEAAAEKALRFAPHCLTGMTSALALLVDQIPHPQPGFRPRLVVTTGELLTAPLRSKIATLGSPIRDIYGSNEFNLLAWECPAGQGTYHVCDDAVVLEVLGPDGKPVEAGQSGEVVITGLHSFAMPFIRYRIGDLAVKGPDRCPCGSPFSTLLEIQGRTIDTFHLAGSIKLHPWTIHNAVRPWLAMVRQACLVQVAPDRLEYLVVATREMGKAEEASISAAAQAALPVGISFALRRVASIPAGPGGKARPFVPWPAPDPTQQAPSGLVRPCGLKPIR